MSEFGIIDNELLDEADELSLPLGYIVEPHFAGGFSVWYLDYINREQRYVARGSTKEDAVNEAFKKINRSREWNPLKF